MSTAPHVGKELHGSVSLALILLVTANGFKGISDEGTVPKGLLPCLGSSTSVGFSVF